MKNEGNKYDGLIEWWCLFHLPKIDHGKMISRFTSWLKSGGILKFTSGDSEYEAKSSDMLNAALCQNGIYARWKWHYIPKSVCSTWEYLSCC